MGANSGNEVKYGESKICRAMLGLSLHILRPDVYKDNK